MKQEKCSLEEEHSVNKKSSGKLKLWTDMGKKKISVSVGKVKEIQKEKKRSNERNGIDSEDWVLWTIFNKSSKEMAGRTAWWNNSKTLS